MKAVTPAALGVVADHLRLVAGRIGLPRDAIP